MSQAGLALAGPLVRATIGRSIAPRRPITVSQWADAHRVLSRKSSPEPGRWRTDRNPILREPMDALSDRSTVREVAMMFPIQLGKSEVGLNLLGYVMDHMPSPVMVCLPSEVSMEKWIAQKLNPLLDETPRVKEALTSTASRESANRRTFKDFAGGQLYVEHAGTPGRLKSQTVRILIVDELDEFARELRSGDDPVEMLEGRTSAYPTTAKRLYISSPQIKGVSRIEQRFELGDQRYCHVPCPHCGHRQPLEWAGLIWTVDPRDPTQVLDAQYACRECGALIDESHKPDMLARHEWVPTYPERSHRHRSYTCNGLYYQLGLGPRWRDLAATWLAAQNDPSKLKTIINDRLAQPWEDPALRRVKHNVVADRAEPYRLRVAPLGVLAITAGVDTQDNRLAVHIIGWGRGLAAWTLDYVELPGDPAADEVWHALTELLNTPIQHASGGVLRVEAVAIDAGGHRTEDVKAFVRARRVRRPLCIFGAVANTAPVLSKGKLEDVTWRGQYDKRGVKIHHVGTVAAKNWLFARLATDAERTPDQRLLHFSDELDPSYFGGLVSETFNPARNRYEKVRGAPRNEPLDTWVYAYAATHHPELRIYRFTRADWDAREAALAKRETSSDAAAQPESPSASTASLLPSRRANLPPRRGNFATTW
jgi:phage terminase large subunit GpA-like protein